MHGFLGVNNMKYIIVENRKNSTLASCVASLERQSIDYAVIDSVASVGFDDFSNCYRHFSTNPESFELICFRRYFLLREYIEKNKIKKFVLLDSDIVVFDGLSDYVGKISSQGDFVGSYVDGQSEVYKRISPHFSIWTDAALNNFVEYLLGAYKKQDVLEELDQIYKKVISSGELGGVSDMTLIYLWATKNSYLGSTAKEIDGLVGDHNITVPDNFFVREYKSFFGVKLIRFGKGRAWGIKRSGQRVGFVLLHFQGKAKKMMPFCSFPLLFYFGIFSLGLLKRIRYYTFKVFS